MEHSSGQEKPSTEPVRPTAVRPPGLEFALGMAVFAVVMLFFFAVQTVVFVLEVNARDPELFAGGFRPGMLADPALQQALEQWMLHGDLVAREAFWSGMLGSLLVWLLVRRWKGAAAARFLGLRMPQARAWLPWMGFFLLLGLLIELLAHLSPVFRTDFMEQVLNTSTQHWYLLLGVGIMAPIFEELLLRGVLLGGLRHVLDEHAAIALSAGVFTLMHVQYTWGVLLLVLALGVVLGYARTRTGSLLVPIALHLANNVLSVLLGP